MRHKIFLAGFWHNNLGDDLFLKIITEKYPQEQFYIVSNDDYSRLAKNGNLHNCGNRVLNKLLRVCSGERIDLSVIVSGFFKVVVYLGGSLFIESGGPYRKYLSGKSRYYVIGANFGPFQSQEYLEYHREFFKNAEDVCFREKASAKLFPSLSGVRAEADVVFGLCDGNSVDIAGDSTEKSVVFSLIDPANRDSIDPADYERGVLSLIHTFAERGYKVKLLSFCKFEGDENFLRKITRKCADVKMESYFYDGDLDAALAFFKDSDVVVGARYHAVILGILFGKYTVPLVYSDKLLHELDDIGYQGKHYDLRTLNWYKSFAADDLYRYEASKIKELAQSARRQFEGLEKKEGIK